MSSYHDGLPLNPAKTDRDLTVYSDIMTSDKDGLRLDSSMGKASWVFRDREE